MKLKELSGGCPSGSTCPAMFEDEHGNFVLIGKLIDPQVAQIAHRVGNDEVAIVVPREIGLSINNSAWNKK